MLVRLLIAMTVLMSGFARADAWESFKSRFVMPDGRVVDTGNGNVSHTEGQGFAMLMAVNLNDRPTFDKLWQWTNATLKNKDNGLFYWRYNPVAADPITDKNDATDGDMMIAWALLKAQKQWRENSYGIASDEITRALLKHTVITYAGYKVMLPGANGFNLNSYINLNPSYFIFPAWKAFADRTHLVAWRDLQRDGQKLLGNMGWGNARLPTDWVSLSADGKMKPADQWKPRMSYDAIRIPLYIRWQDPQSALLTPWKAWWGRYQREKTPAWVNVLSNETSPYPMNGGLLAVRDFTMGINSGEPQITAQDDYYSASLKMLTWLAERDITK
ncbi:MAG: glycosyl hydrolase family 8 [Scandinavium sp.]|uniref:glycosyl hydrolase family 8 n=1 Tax=Scandinavium sp. TaxID=2830653 RepID=UPI003F393B0A